MSAEEERGHEVRASGRVQGRKAFICRIISDGFMLPISGNLCSLNALAQWSMVYLVISSSFSCSYALSAFSSISARLSLMLLQMSVAGLRAGDRILLKPALCCRFWVCFRFCETRCWVVGPEVRNLECHVGHVLVLVVSVFIFCRHFGCSQRSVA